MKFTATLLPDVFVLDIEPSLDERGFFARTFDRSMFETRGLSSAVVECDVSFNLKRGTLRGLHFQEVPFAQAKLVRVTAGSAFDVVVDLRADAPTYRAWFGVELSAANRRAVYVPEGLAHGFVTLEDDTEVAYQLSAPYEPHAARGVRWNDAAFGINWPIEPVMMSERDSTYPDLPR